MTLTTDRAMVRAVVMDAKRRLAQVTGEPVRNIRVHHPKNGPPGVFYLRIVRQKKAA